MQLGLKIAWKFLFWQFSAGQIFKDGNMEGKFFNEGGGGGGWGNKCVKQILQLVNLPANFLMGRKEISRAIFSKGGKSSKLGQHLQFLT